MACPVCFGDSSDPLALAMNFGIWFMLAIVATVLTGFASFFIYLMRRAKRVAQAEAAETARFVGSHEGTAQC